ncbi:MAG TPA: hypothetical protein VK607_03510 [Kofleriaceae bacterium]|nr:hypothetical protein [Kofleriaceae bacterium]HMG58020.1 hypothetical protein [Kofleriaceae bacterium]
MTITTSEVRRAASELAKMRGSLAAWLKFRTLNDRVLAGTTAVAKPLPYAQNVIASARGLSVEQDLATKLHALLEVVMKGQPLPNADLRSNSQAAVQLAQLALMGGQSVSSPQATGSLAGMPWLWPVLIVGGVLLTVLTAIKSSADVAKDQEEKACIMAGACTDYGFWLKAGGLCALAWFAWEKLGVRQFVAKKGRS